MGRDKTGMQVKCRYYWYPSHHVISSNKFPQLKHTNCDPGTITLSVRNWSKSLESEPFQAFSRLILTFLLLLLLYYIHVGVKGSYLHVSIYLYYIVLPPFRPPEQRSAPPKLGQTGLTFFWFNFKFLSHTHHTLSSPFNLTLANQLL